MNGCKQKFKAKKDFFVDSQIFDYPVEKFYLCTPKKDNIILCMTEKPECTVSRDCILQLIHTRMASRQAMQRLLRNSNAGITFEMLQIMSCLWNEQGISQQKLAERTAKDKACLTSLMANLERKGYVCRREDPKDRRNKLVYLTDEGERFHQWIAPILAAYYERLEEVLGRDTLQQTEELLKELQHAIESY